MYIIIIKRGVHHYSCGSWPTILIDMFIKEYGGEFIVISTYSNTIKIPVAKYQDTTTGEIEWGWNEFPMPPSFQFNYSEED